MTTTATEAVRAAAHAAADKKAADITILDVSRQLVITDHFLICSGNTERQVKTIADEVDKRLREGFRLSPFRREGEREARWVLLDYVDFVVHIFHREERDYYDLERLWADAPSERFDEGFEDDDRAAAKAT
ncbi:MAG TPA: ribosome silencing factor [Actinomycetota bacterium]|jgi:ribosome-associated protein|nr:ribosome silencing factor [Actinomycetota bacterium]